jgi:hypothetical protein
VTHLGKSQPDCFHGMVELCARRAYGGAGIPQSDPTHRTGRIGCARHHRYSLDRAGSGEAGEAGFGSRCVGRPQKEADPDIPILKRAKAEYAKLQ